MLLYDELMKPKALMRPVSMEVGIPFSRFSSDKSKQCLLPASRLAFSSK